MIYNKFMRKKFLNYTLGFIILGFIIASFMISKIALFITSAIFITFSMIEFRTMFKTKNIFPHMFLPEITGIALAFVFIFNPYENSSIRFILPLLIFSTILSFLITIIKNKKPYLENSLSTILAIIFIFCGLYIIKIPSVVENTYSIKLLLIYFLTVLAGDFIASKLGNYGKKQLSPEISPKKTVLGAFSNIIISCLICLLLKDIMSIYQCLSLGFVISLSSQTGDLTLSTVKRYLELKHSGSLFFDYGGIFDRIDAFIFSAPVTYYFLYLLTEIVS